MEMSNSTDGSEPWNIQTARNLYNIHRWGAEYFDINDAGHVVAKPLRDAGACVDLTDVIEEAKGRGLKFPLLIRFQDILRHRVESINLAFRSSIAEFNYRGKYRGVFPIKVNQLREVVEEILDAGKPYDFGLEIGSKPELFAGLALQSQLGSLIVCNGYKDASFIRMALLGTKLNKKVIMVVEKLGELRQIITLSRQLGVEPLIGIRTRLLSRGAGKWAESAGENAKFGLTTAELLAATEMLKAENLSHCFKLLHFHIGSQVPDILIVKKAVQEASRFYAKLYKMGFQIEYLDVGGGLGVDYDGSRSAFSSSTNYTLQEYANDIIYYVGDVCDAEKVPHPDIISESGRAIVAHHSVLIVEVFGAIEKVQLPERVQYGENEPPLVRELLDIRKNLPKVNKLEAFHDAQERKEDAQHMFTLGMMDLPEKAKIEDLYWEIGREVVESFKARRMCRRRFANSKTASATSTSAISRYFNRCSTTGRSTSCSPSCRSAASTNARPAKPRSWTSPAIPTARSISSLTFATCATRCRCIVSTPTATDSWSPIISVSSSWVPTRTSWGTCITCSGASMRSTSSSNPMSRRAIMSRRSLRGTPSSSASPPSNMTRMS